MFSHLPHSVLQVAAIFLSIIIEALPFVLLGSLISGVIETYLTPDRVKHFLPKHKLLNIFLGTAVGFIFPSCECGIVPIITRFLEKKVPSYTAVPFLVTAPIINPIVLFATYSAFGNTWQYALLRVFGAILVATILGILLGFVVNDHILKHDSTTDQHEHHTASKNIGQNIFSALSHAVDEFFDTGRYLVFGSLITSLIQIYVPTRVLTGIGQTPLVAIIIMMTLAFLLSLCSEADAFIGASLVTSFGMAPTLAFLLFGPMVDIKNLLMMTKAFTWRFVGIFITTTSLTIIAYCLLIGVIL